MCYGGDETVASSADAERLDDVTEMVWCSARVPCEFSYADGCEVPMIALTGAVTVDAI